MRIAIIGASGFIGRTLTRHLLATTSYRLTLFSHASTKMHYSPYDEQRLTHVDGSIMNTEDISRALQDADMAVYLVHLMGSKSEFLEREKTAAHNFINASQNHGIKGIVYVGGMGQDNHALTNHLASRATTAQIFQAADIPVIELRTPMVIGKGGAGFEVLAGMVTKLPVFPVPRWANAVTRPITVDDVVRYCTASLQLKATKSLVVDIGGPERLTYVDVAKRYARYKRIRFRSLSLPFVTKSMARLALHPFSKNPYVATVKDMIDSAGYSTVEQSSAAEHFPGIIPEPIESGFR